MAIAKKKTATRREGYPSALAQTLIVSDLLSEAGLEVHQAAKKQPYDLFFTDKSGTGIAIRCGISVPARYPRQFHAWLDKAVSSLPGAISELWLMDVSFPREVMALAADYKNVRIWELDALAERYGRGEPKNIDVRGTNALIGAVVKLLRNEGFRPLVSMDFSGSAPVSVTFKAQDGNVIGVYCGRLSRLRTEAAVQQWIRHVEHENHTVGEVVIVNTYFPDYVRVAIEPFAGVDAVEYPQFAEWVQRYKKKPLPVPKSAAKPKTVVARIKANKEQILLAVEALTASIDDKLDGLRRTKPNSDDAIAAHEAAISDYEKLRTKAIELREAVNKLSMNRASQAKAEKKASAFGKMMSNWLKMDAGAVLTTTANVGVFCLGALLCTMMNVAPEVAVAATAWVTTGKKPMKALKKAAKAITGAS